MPSLFSSHPLGLVMKSTRPAGNIADKILLNIPLVSPTLTSPVSSDENPNIPIKYGIQSIPTLIILKKGSEISRKVGGIVKSDLLTWIKTSI